MGTASGNRLRPEEHITGGPVVSQAVNTPGGERGRDPFGRLRGENRYEPLADGRLGVSTRVDVHGPFGSLFHLIWESRRRADMYKGFAALEAKAGRSG